MVLKVLGLANGASFCFLLMRSSKACVGAQNVYLEAVPCSKVVDALALNQIIRQHIRNHN